MASGYNWQEAGAVGGVLYEVGEDMFDGPMKSVPNPTAGSYNVR